jgi:hypothetical protein
MRALCVLRALTLTLAALPCACVRAEPARNKAKLSFPPPPVLEERKIKTKKKSQTKLNNL